MAKPKNQIKRGYGWTPTERRIWDLLQDGLPHPRAEVLACLLDSESSISALSMQLSNMRKKLAPRLTFVTTVRCHQRCIQLVGTVAKARIPREAARGV